MPRTSRHPKDESFNFRIDPALKASVVAATEAEDRPAAQVLRDFMRAYVNRRKQRVFEAEARRQSLVIAARARDPGSDDDAVMHEIEADLEGDESADERHA